MIFFIISLQNMTAHYNLFDKMRQSEGSQLMFLLRYIENYPKIIPVTLI